MEGKTGKALLAVYAAAGVGMTIYIAMSIVMQR